MPARDYMFFMLLCYIYNHFLAICGPRSTSMHLTVEKVNCFYSWCYNKRPITFRVAGIAVYAKQDPSMDRFMEKLHQELPFHLQRCSIVSGDVPLSNSTAFTCLFTCAKTSPFENPKNTAQSKMDDFIFHSSLAYNL